MIKGSLQRTLIELLISCIKYDSTHELSVLILTLNLLKQIQC